MTEAQPRTRILLIALAIAGAFLAVGLLLLVALVALLSPPRGRPTGRVPLEFHVLASRARDREAIERATAPDALAEAPKGFRWVEVDDRSDVFGTPGMIFRDGDDDGRVFREVLVKLTPDDLTHEQIDRVYLTQDSQRHPALGMDFNAEGSRRMQALTGSHIPEDGGLVKYQLGILIDGRLVSAPSINSPIADRAVIEFGSRFNTREAEELVDRMTEPLDDEGP